MNEERLKFAKRLAEVAENLGYRGHGRQTRLAEHYKKSQPSVKKWFDGEAMPDYETCVDLCKRAKVNFEWFMTGRGPKHYEASGAGDVEHSLREMALIYVTQHEMGILTAYRESTELGKKLIETAVKSAPREQSATLLASNHKS